MNGLAIGGFDRLVDGEGEMRWKLLGLFPVMTASGPDISRSAAGRFMTESAWCDCFLSDLDDGMPFRVRRLAINYSEKTCVAI